MQPCKKPGAVDLVVFVRCTHPYWLSKTAPSLSTIAPDDSAQLVLNVGDGDEITPPGNWGVCGFHGQDSVWVPESELGRAGLVPLGENSGGVGVGVLGCLHRR